MKIGSKVFLIHKSFGQKENKHGAKIIVAKCVTFENKNGTVVPILMVGKIEYSVANYDVFDTFEEALNNLT